MHMNKKGFTLMELIAVIIIIGVLSAVAVGSYRRAMERAHMTEAYNVGSHLLESVNRYYYENRSSDDRKCPQGAKLDMGASRTSGNACTAVEGDYCVSTQYFEIYWGEKGECPSDCSPVTAKDKKGNYVLQFFPDFCSFRSQDRCVFNNAKGKNYCLTSGYKVCNDSSKICCKGSITSSGYCK